MSTAALSPHIPDFDLITFYAEKKESFASSFSPWTKFIALMFTVAFVTITGNLLLLSGLFLAVISLWIITGLPLKKLAGWYTLPVVFVISLIAILMWNEPGQPLASAGIAGFTITLTDNGLALAVTLLLKALITVTMSLYLLMTTKYRHFAGMIARVFPSPLDQIFLMAYRFLFLTLTMTAALLRSVRARGGGLAHSIRIQGRLFAGIFALIFIRSFEQGERVHRAMTARGFSGTYTVYGEVPGPAVSGYAAIFCMGLAIAALLWTGGTV